MTKKQKIHHIIYLTYPLNNKKFSMTRNLIVEWLLETFSHLAYLQKDYIENNPIKIAVKIIITHLEY